MQWFLSDPLWPFTLAAVVLLALVVIEFGGMLFGSSISDLIEASSIGDALESALGWLNVGKVPFLVLLMGELALFSAGGMVLQSLAAASIGVLPAMIAVPLAAVAALAFTRSLSRFLARILPGDETYALVDSDFMGRTGVVTVGPLQADGVGRARFIDPHGNKHFPRVRPADPNDVMAVGTAVLIVAREGREFRVVRAPTERVGDDVTSI